MILIHMIIIDDTTDGCSTFAIIHDFVDQQDCFLGICLHSAADLCILPRTLMEIMPFWAGGWGGRWFHTG